MKRDRDLLRDLLLELVTAPEGFLIHVLTSSSTEEDMRRDHHLDLLMDEGLVTKKGANTFRLTPLGHDAIEAIENPERWKDLKSRLPSEAYGVIKGVSSSLATSALSKLMGWN